MCSGVERITINCASKVVGEEEAGRYGDGRWFANKAPLTALLAWLTIEGMYTLGTEDPFC